MYIYNFTLKFICNIINLLTIRIKVVAVRFWKLAILCLFMLAQDAYANTPNAKLCNQGERFFDASYQNVYNKQIYKISLTETFKHFVNMHQNCETKESLNSYIIRISEIITNRDLESHIESQLIETKDYENMMLFLEGLSSNIYQIWKDKKHSCNSKESIILLKLNRLGNIYSRNDQARLCQKCFDIFEKMDNRVSKTYTCDDVLWFGE